MDLVVAVGRATVLALLALGASSLQGCAGDPSLDPSGQSDDRNLGELSLSLDLSPGATVSSVSYEISGNGFFKAGTVDVSQSTEIAFTVYGIPAGQGYTISLKAGGASDGFTCAGSTTFSIAAGQISQAHVELQCEVAHGTGGVSVGASINVCPTLSDLTAAPSAAIVGGTIRLTALAEDSDEGPQDVSYAWTSTIGKLSGESSADASLACTDVGTGSVTLAYSDGSCTRQLSLPVSCTRRSVSTSSSMLSASNTHACRVRRDGRAVCWGDPAAVGFETGAISQQTASFVDARALPLGLESTWKSVSAGYRHTCGVTTGGVGYCWGSNSSGQLGDGALGVATTPRPIDTSLLPAGTTWSVLTAGHFATCGVATGGTGYCWGSDANGRLGNGAAAEDQLTPRPIDVSALPQGTAWSVLSAGESHICGITTDGTAYCWGSDANGKLGNGPALTADQASPSAVDLSALPAGTTWATISTNNSHTCGVTTAGDAYCWGSNESGKLGNGDSNRTDQDRPTPVSVSALPSGTRWTWVTAGRAHTCGITTDGTAYCWGSGASGALGTGTTTASPTPIAINMTALPADTAWTEVDAGDTYTCGLTTKGTTYCWGNDGNGRLGNGGGASHERAPTSPLVTTLGIVGINVPLVDGGLGTRRFEGAIGDPTNPELTFSVVPLETAVEDLVVTVQSSNEAVVPAANVTVSGTSSDRVATLVPVGVGWTTLTFTVSDPSGNQAAFSVNYGASGTPTDASGRYHMGIGDASTAIDVGDGYMLVADDETNFLYLYRQNESGYAVKSWNLRDVNLLGPTERDLEGAARIGDLIVWTASQGNARDGSAKDYRRVIFATRVIGSGADVEIEFAGRYGGVGSKNEQAAQGLRPDLLNWDSSNGHGLGANFLGFVAGSQEGVLPNAPSGFNVEGFEFAADGTTGYLGFRAPTVNIEGKQRALIVPVTNVLDLVNGISTQNSGRAAFGAPIFLDLEGRSIRELRRNDAGEYLISAGPPDNPTVGVNDTWALYVWDGDATHAPVLNQLLPTPNMLTDGVWESIVSAPNPITSGAEVRFVCDSGDVVFYGGTATGHSKSYSQLVKLQ